MVSLCNMQQYVIYNIQYNIIYNVPRQLLLYSQLTGSTNNLMMAHLQDRNIYLYITYCCILYSDTI